MPVDTELHRTPSTIDRTHDAGKRSSRRKKLLTRGVPAIATAITLATGAVDVPPGSTVKDAIRGDAGIISDARSIEYKKPLLDQSFAASLSPYPDIDRNTTGLIIRVSPNTVSDIVDQEEFSGSLRRGALEPVQVRLVAGQRYPGPDRLSDTQQQRVKEVGDAWKEELKKLGIRNYWNFQRGRAHFGVWAMVTLADPVRVNGKDVSSVFLSLHQVQPMLQSSMGQPSPTK